MRAGQRRMPMHPCLRWYEYRYGRLRHEVPPLPTDFRGARLDCGVFAASLLFSAVVQGVFALVVTVGVFDAEGVAFDGENPGVAEIRFALDLVLMA